MQGSSWRLSAFETLAAMACEWEGIDASDRLFLFLLTVGGPDISRKLA